MQTLKAAPSRLHWKVELASVEVKLKLAEELFVRAAGLAVMDVSGGVLSTVMVTDEVAGLPAVSTARAVMVLEPSAAVAEFQLKL